MSTSTNLIVLWYYIRFCVKYIKDRLWSCTPLILSPNSHPLREIKKSKVGRVVQGKILLKVGNGLVTKIVEVAEWVMRVVQLKNRSDTFFS